MSGPPASVLDHPVVSARYFWPRADAVPASARFVVPTRDGDELHCARIGSGPDWVLHFHGNGEVADDWLELLPPLFAAAGFSTVLVEYRGYGGSSGEPRLCGMLPDGEDVLRALGTTGRVVAFGRSIGSLYAVELAARTPLRGLVLDSGIHDLTERLLVRLAPRELGTDDASLRREVATWFDQGAKLGLHAGPTLLLHAEDDDMVHVRHAHRNAAAARHPTLALFPQGGHNALFAANTTAYAEALVGFLRGL
jgi:pimeloyl-ACP methyl ester carboxylesterase